MATISDYPALQAWLDKHEARFCFSLLPRTDKQSTPSIEAWRVGTGIAYVVLYPGTKGWDIVTGCSSHEIAKTFADAESRLGVHRDQLTVPFTAFASEIGGQVTIAVTGCTGQHTAGVCSDPNCRFRAPTGEQGATATVVGEPLKSASDLAETVRVYLDWLRQNRSDKYDLDDRAEAKKQMAVYEEQLKQLSGWHEGRGRR
jgi:hypothetical protein